MLKSLFDTALGRLQLDILLQPAHIALLIAAAVFLTSILLATALRSRAAIRKRAIELPSVTPGTGLGSTLDDTERKRGASLVERAGRAVQPRKGKEVAGIKMQLIQAGFFSPAAVPMFYGFRILTALGLPLAVLIALRLLIPDFGAEWLVLVAAAASMAGLIIPGVVLDRLQVRARNLYRHAFPDFMDLMVVCVEAGQSLQGALERVGREMVQTCPPLGANLHLVNLELRAGRDLSGALDGLAHRLGIDEVRSLALLMRQSQELGTSLSTTLRVFSEEMRDKRMMRAEARANALPVKMVIPLGMFMFPVILLVIMVPVIIRIRTAFV